MLNKQHFADSTTGTLKVLYRKRNQIKWLWIRNHNDWGNLTNNKYNKLINTMMTPKKLAIQINNKK